MLLGEALFKNVKARSIGPAVMGGRVSDIAIDPQSPLTLYAAMYQRRRTPFGFNGGGPASALYKTIDGGATWRKLTNGLPTESPIGRIGIDIYRGNPSILYAVVESAKGGTFRSEDRGATWTGPWPMTGMTVPNSSAQVLVTLSNGDVVGPLETFKTFDEPGLSARERQFLLVMRGAFEQAAADDRQLFVGGTATLLDEMRVEEIGAYRSLMEALEKRAALLDVVAQRLDPRRPFARVGEELEQPSLRELALVGATYGLAHQTLGSVSLLGPLRMDYEKALHSVRSAAFELSRFVELITEADHGVGAPFPVLGHQRKRALQQAHRSRRVASSAR